MAVSSRGDKEVQR